MEEIEQRLQEAEASNSDMNLLKAELVPIFAIVLQPFVFRTNELLNWIEISVH